MQGKQKIALLNLPVDNNYGGHLQRYALVTILQRMGYDVTHLNVRFPSAQRSAAKYALGWVKRLLMYPYYWITKSPKYKSFRYIRYYLQGEPITEAFYEKYIPHTSRIYNQEELKQYQDFDGYIVGSDQVWRKKYMPFFGDDYGVWFLNFAADKLCIAYGASLGTDEQEFSPIEQERIRPLYNKFRAVSVRENSALDILQEYGWTEPKAETVIDPTFMLTANDYLNLIKCSKTEPLQNKLLCYVLDMNDDKWHTIEQIAKENNIEPHVQTLDKNTNTSVEQWLRNFSEAEYVITDSYHGVVFSLIFHKPFKLIMNESRGKTRFEGIEHQLHIHLQEPIDRNKLDCQIDKAREHAKEFLIKALHKK